MASLLLKSDVEYLWEVAGRTEQYAQLLVGTAPAPTGKLLERANAAAASVVVVRDQLQVALSKFTGPYPPLSPVDFWLVLTVMRSSRDQLTVAQSKLAAVDREHHAATGRPLTTFPRATERAGVLQQVGEAARYTAYAFGAVALTMVVWAIVRR